MNTRTSLVALAVVLMACGGEDNPAAPATPPAAQPPADPTALSAVSTGTSTIGLGWTDGSDNEADFRIERGLSATGPFSQIGTTGPNVAVFGDSGLMDATEYCYQVRAGNADGTSGYTNVSCATTDALSPPAAPSALSAMSSGTNTIDLGWTDGSDNEDDFRIERGLSATGPFSEIGTTGPNVVVFGDSGLTQGTEYCYRVRAGNADGMSGYTDVSCATTLLPSPVTLAAALNVSQIVVDLVEQDCTPVTAGTDPATLVWLVPFSQAATGICDTGNIFPVNAPDGQQLTFGEWSTATGSVTITCLVGGGTRFDVAFAGLIPNGVYTIWHFIPTGEGALASHPPADINNIFTANGTGFVNASVTGTAGAMTLFGSAPSCQLPVPFQSQVGFGVTMVILYHTDNMTWGGSAGPEETGIAHMYGLGL